VLFASCGAYKQNIMFKVDGANALTKQLATAESNYKIQKDDRLTLEVYTNAGEKIVDPNRESFKEASDKLQQEDEIEYLVDVSGIVKLPLIGAINLDGLTIRQAEEVLAKEYSKYYKEPFVVLKFTNKRVVVLGSPGGQVIPLLNENTKLTEVLALAKGIDIKGKAHNIRVLRGNTAFVADLSTLEGYLKNDIIIQPDDIVYIEPVRRGFSEGVAEFAPVIAMLSSMTTLVLVILEFDDHP
jgi:polysaccharide export outer membrane protein